MNHLGTRVRFFSAAAGVGFVLISNLLPLSSLLPGDAFEPVSCLAQDDPFDFGSPDSNDDSSPFGGGFGGDAGGGVFGAGPVNGAAGAGAGAAEGPILPTDPLVRELRTLAGGSPSQLGLAIREAIRLKKWTELEAYLGGGRVTGLDDQGKLAVARRVGSLLLVRALAGPDSDRPDLSDASKTALESLVEVLNNNAVNPQRLDAAIEQLGSDQRNEQLQAVRVLRAGGEATIQRVVRAAITEQSPQKLNRLMELLGSFGEPGFEAIELLASFGSDQVRPGALRAASILDSRRALPAVLAAVAARGSTEAEREIAAKILNDSLGGLPSRPEVRTYLAQRLELAEDRYQTTGPAAGATTIWRTTSDRTSVETVVTSSRLAAAREAANLAELLRRVGGLGADGLGADDLDGQILADALGADLRNRMLSNPVYGSPEDLRELTELWGSAMLDYQTASRILARALGDRMLGGGIAEPKNRTIGDPALAIAAIRILAAIGNDAAVDARGRTFAPLVEAVSHPVPQVRFEAATAIEMLHPRHAYAGSSIVLQRWVDMSKLSNLPRAIILMNNPPMKQALETRLTLLGYQITEVTSVAGLLMEVDRGGDLELIVASSRPPDYSAIEMIDRIRRRPLGGAVPLILVNGWPAGYEQFDQRWRASNVMIAADFENLPLSAEPIVENVAAGTAIAYAETEVRRDLTPAEAVLQMQLALIHLAESNPLPEMTAGDREIYALAGLTALSRLIEDPETAEIYDWRSLEADLTEASRRSGYSEASLRILSAMGTPYSQDLLARVAVNPGLALATRKFAAQAFADSIATAGTRISRRQILGHYDRFNQSRDANMRDVLNTILDAIEARAGVTNP